MSPLPARFTGRWDNPARPSYENAVCWHLLLGKCDVKTLARESAVDRTAFYGSRPYARLREEFEARLAATFRDDGTPDPRGAQISRLKAEAVTLRERLARQDTTITELTEFKAHALSRIAAQHDEFAQLRRDIQRAASVRRLPTAAS